jgi:hypothetical protein
VSRGAAAADGARTDLSTRLTLVELLGPPGIGKSTIAAGLLRSRRRWADARQLVEPVRLPAALATPWVQRVAHQLPRAVGARLRRVPSTSERTAALVRVEDRWRDFVEVCADAPGDPALAPTLRLLTLSWLLEALVLRALVEALRDDPGPFAGWWCLLDEGLTHPYKLEAAAPPGDGGARRSRYLASVPLPDLTVVLDAPPELVLDRLEQRRRAGRPTDRHRGMDTDALRREAERTCLAIEEAVGTIRARGGRLLVLDAERPAGALADEVVAAAGRA